MGILTDLHRIEALTILHGRMMRTSLIAVMVVAMLVISLSDETEAHPGHPGDNLSRLPMKRGQGSGRWLGEKRGGKREFKRGTEAGSASNKKRQGCSSYQGGLGC